ncbi:MAG: ribonuclease H family protein, partial [Nitrososphaerales archaeon]
MYKYLIKIDNTFSNPAKVILEERAYPTLERKFNSIYQKLLEDAYDFNHHIKEPTVEYNLSQITNSNLDIDTTLINFMKKSHKDNNLLESLQNKIQDMFPNHIIVYVDGSKLEDGRSGIALYIPDYLTSQANRVSDGLTVYTIEATAILEALKFANKHLIHNPVILSDSLEVLEDLKRGRSRKRPKLFQSIHAVSELFSNRISVTWIPSHILPEHNVADNLARAATRQNITIMIHQEIKDVEAVIQTNLNKEWLKNWENYTKDKPYKAVFSFTPKGYSFNIKNRSMETMINRLRLH